MRKLLNGTLRESPYAMRMHRHERPPGNPAWDEWGGAPARNQSERGLGRQRSNCTTIAGAPEGELIDEAVQSAQRSSRLRSGKSAERPYNGWVFDIADPR